ncbi:hypothetical protein D9V96_013695 [Zobellia laminariae]|uniref:hypothetical protein n=1 Tax=Zobellia laminariae TaxID=248906 RepID=UPI0012D95BAC|nr:hypothetical protein [Zobellia laminariae]
MGGSRLKEIETVKSFLTNDERVLYIKSITTDEAVAFPLAVLKRLDGVSHTLIRIISKEL